LVKNSALVPMKLINISILSAALITCVPLSSCTSNFFFASAQSVSGTWRAEQNTLIGPQRWELLLDERGHFRLTSSDPIIPTWIAIGSWTQSGRKVSLQIEKWGATDSQLTNPPATIEVAMTMVYGERNVIVLRDEQERLHFRK
jgi:hypothetical protein